MIYLVRHGQTEMNLQGRIQGQGDAPLTDAGRSLASKIGQRLAEDIGSSTALIFTSPLGRAAQTAGIIANSLHNATSVIEDERLAEVNLGEWDGLTIAEIDQGWPEARTSAPPGEWFFNAPNGESFESFRQRNAAFLRDLGGADASIKILVTHGISGRVLRGLHAGLGRQETVNLPVPNEAFFVMREDGSVDEIAVP
ncbi:histidine phosphatase family protein [Aestuariicoccus sp. MJ-SS9]|uniref:histidine phosphatase family protein n=1 Tax=Aestuariicoccus sp. MJ-SS9 TaxID=3079855 RepID=UPI0029102679|nr:histidine phosphatase family protein [Aestuariicoccus sp. MJ-SS9]MDU8914087.1 histidine phosphatase family protein [Aestuariicoccus sp. MJ-SS9]